jgi:peptidoglycan/LPS O-acetylase OafA/YrhL
MAEAAPLHLRQLTALRFFAAAWVVLYDYLPLLTGGQPPVIAKGYLGVELFFVLSGFILCHVYLAAFGEKKAGYLAFLWARLARIYPAHLAILLGLILLVVAARLAGLDLGGKLAVPESLPAQILLLQAWGLAPHGGWNHPAWSISAEWFAYLTFPVFAFVFWRLRRRPWLALGLAAAAGVALNLGFEAWTGEPLTRATLFWGALRIVPCFALGCAVWLVWSAGFPKGRTAAAGLALGALAAILAVTALGGPDWAAILAFGALILGLGAMAREGSPRLTHPILVYLGEVSFAVYMVCIPWLLVVQDGAGHVLGLTGERLPWPLWLVLIGGVVPAAMVVHHLVERPAREIMRRHGVPFVWRPAPAPAPTPPDDPHEILAADLWRHTYGRPPTPGVSPALLLRIIAFTRPRRS